MRDLLIIVLLLDSLAMIGLILLQHGKGADAGASFGGGAGGGGGGSQSMFGSKGSSNFLSKTTAILAVIFFTVTLALAYAPLDGQTSKSVTEVSPTATPQDVPTLDKSKKKAGVATKQDDLPEVPR